MYEHRGNGLIVDNIMKPLKAALSTAASKAGRAVAKKIGKKKASKTAKATKSIVGEISGDHIRKRLTKVRGPQTPRGRSRASNAKMSQNEVNTLINDLIARS